MTRSRAPATSISCAHISGVSTRPKARAPAAGNALVRSGVLVKMTLYTSFTATLLRLQHAAE